MSQGCAKLFVLGLYIEWWIPELTVSTSTMTHSICLSDLRMDFERVVIHTGLHSPLKTILARFILKITFTFPLPSDIRNNLLLWWILLIHPTDVNVQSQKTIKP